MKKILIIQQKMIGDVLTSSILFEELKKHFPKYQLHYLINFHTYPVVENHPHIDKFIFYTPEIKSDKIKFYSFLKNIRKEKYDIVIDVYGKISSQLITCFSKAPIRIGTKKNPVFKMYTHIVFNKKAAQQKNIPLAIENRLNLLSCIDITVDYTTKPRIYITEEEKSNGITKIAKHGVFLKEDPYVMISLLGSEISKTYPLTYLAELTNIISHDFPALKFLLNYLPSQKESVETFLSNINPVTLSKINRYYSDNLREFIVLCSFCKGVVGNEGGAINIAKALKIPTFAIFSPWITTEAWGEPKENSLHKTVHIKDYKPELFKNKKTKALKKNYAALYQQFTPGFIEKELLDFVNQLAFDQKKETSD